MPAIEKERLKPDRQNLDLVRRCAQSIEADRAEMKQWLTAYKRNHIERIALDMEIVQRYATKDTKILEFGSVPLLLTSALHSTGYNIEGVDIDPHRFNFLYQTAWSGSTRVRYRKR